MEEEPKPVYANVISITTGPFDIIMDFGYKSPERAKEHSGKYEIVARIAMSLTHAKTILPLLVDQIAKYEDAYGVIPAPAFKPNIKKEK